MRKGKHNRAEQIRVMLEKQGAIMKPHRVRVSLPLSPQTKTTLSRDTSP